MQFITLLALPLLALAGDLPECQASVVCPYYALYRPRGKEACVHPDGSRGCDLSYNRSGVLVQCDASTRLSKC